MDPYRHERRRWLPKGELVKGLETSQADPGCATISPNSPNSPNSLGETPDDLDDL
jgi:hypothetical protein